MHRNGCTGCRVAEESLEHLDGDDPSITVCKTIVLPLHHRCLRRDRVVGFEPAYFDFADHCVSKVFAEPIS